jgi:hypothetical protein
MNKMAAKLTRRRSDKYPGGNLCHVELMIQAKKNKWYRISVVKKSCKRQDEQGQPIWTPGKVHVKPVNQQSWDQKYKFLGLRMPRAQQAQLWETLKVQFEAPFNLYGYALNMFLPFGRIGTWRYSKRLDIVQVKWYCTELVLALLQAAGRREGNRAPWEVAVWSHACNTSNPNSLWRLLDGAAGVQRFLDPAARRGLAV